MDGIKHIFFDLDHTLWDFDRNSELAFKQIFEEQEINLDFNEFMRVYVPINFKYWKLYRDEKVSKPDLRYGRLKDAFDTLNYQVSDEFINQMSVDYLNYLPNHNHLIGGTVEVLEYLYKKYTLHIITNGFKEVQNQKMEASNIKKYFDVIVTSESVGVKKPNAKVFEFALEKANAISAESIMIGDNIEADVMGAFNVGILPIHFKNGAETSANGFASIESLLELKQYL